MAAAERYSSAWPSVPATELSPVLRSDLVGLSSYLGSPLDLHRVSERVVASCVEVSVDLPQRGTYQNIDIRSREPLLVLCDEDYPYSAPQVRSDRIDFPADRLPHVNPTVRQEPPWLCLHRGNIDDYFAGASLADLLERARRWLSDASSNKLISAHDYFEPTRVIDRELQFIADLTLLHSASERYPRARPTGTNAFYHAELRMAEGDGSAAIARLQQVIPQGPIDSATLSKIRSSVREPWRSVFGVAAWNPEYRDDRYFVRLPETFGALCEWAKSREIAVEQAVNRAIKELRWDALIGNFASGGHLLVSVGLRRPQPVLGADGADREWLTFMIDVQNARGRSNVQRDASVKIMAHRKPLVSKDAAYLSRMRSPQRKRVMILGCGAIGSRVGLHMGRSGAVDLAVCDSATLAPHHFVRHGSSSVFEGEYKVDALFNELLWMFRNEPVATRPELRSIRSSAFKLLRAPNLLGDRELLVDMTASVSVLHALVARSDLPRACRVARAEIADNGQLGLVYIEGDERSPRLDDLRVFLFDLARTNDRVRAWLRRFREQVEHNRGPVLEEVEIGLGCSSDTTRLDDASVAFHASMAAKIFMQPEITVRGHGLMFVSVLDSNGTISNITCNVPPFVCPQHTDLPEWSVRLAANAVSEINQLAKAAGRNETGGLLLGVAQAKQRTIYVTSILGPSSDSLGSPSAFVRGREGYATMLDDIAEQTGHIIRYVGEWHVHPSGSSFPSSTDRQALKRIGNELSDRTIPALCLIRGSDGSLGAWFER